MPLQNLIKVMVPINSSIEVIKQFTKCFFSNNTYYISTSGAEGVCSTHIQMSAVHTEQYLYIVVAILL